MYVPKKFYRQQDLNHLFDSQLKAISFTGRPQLDRLELFTVNNKDYNLFGS